ncbi:hypothetical protein SRHO_G00284230 [Serrasalmus rhombeus]
MEAQATVGAGLVAAVTASEGGVGPGEADSNGSPLRGWFTPGGQVYWLTLSTAGTLRRVSALATQDLAQISYYGNTRPAGNP